jgi:hypothetical protein
MRAPEVAGILIRRLGDFTERNRNLALDALLRTPERVEALLAAVESRQISAGMLGAERIQILRNRPEANLREGARALFPD